MKAKMISLFVVPLVLICTILSGCSTGQHENSQLEKILSAAEIGGIDSLSGNAEGLKVGGQLICKNEVYYSDKTSIYKRGDDNAVLVTDGEIVDFTFNGDMIYYVLSSENDSLIYDALHCYDTKTSEDTVICDDILNISQGNNGEVLYVKMISDFDTEWEIYKYDESGRSSELLCRVPENPPHLAPKPEKIVLHNSKLVVLTEQSDARVLMYDPETKEWETAYENKSRGALMSCCVNDNGLFLSIENLTSSEDGKGFETLDSDMNGLFYREWNNTELTKISDKWYDELYFVNGKLIGANENEISLIQ